MDNNKNNKIVVISAPSGAGKTSIVHYLLESLEDKIAFSISACNRQKRKGEVDGKDYYFLRTSDFLEKIDNESFLEWEEVYQNNYYGTLKSEIERIWQLNKTVLIEVDVKGALNIKKLYPKKTLSIFINVPSLTILKKRLESRGTETEAQIDKRIRKAAFEISFAKEFDAQIMNEVLENAQNDAKLTITNFLANNY